MCNFKIPQISVKKPNKQTVKKTKLQTAFLPHRCHATLIVRTTCFATKTFLSFPIIEFKKT